MNMQKIILYILGGLLLAGGIIAYSLYTKEHESVKDQKPEVEISAMDLFKAFSEDETASNAKYLNKIIQVNGTVVKTDFSGENQQVFLKSEDGMFGIACEMAPGISLPGLRPGDEVTLRGICSGFLMDVALNRCEPIE